MEKMSQAEYARHRGVSRQMIGKLIASGKIPAAAISLENGTKQIVVAAADFALGETIERVVARSVDQPDVDAGDSAAAASGDFSGAGAGLTKARTASAYYQANLARLQYEEKIGKLVSRADLEIAMHRAAEALARDIDQISARADDIATAFTRDGIDGARAYLKQMARDIRANIAGNMRLLEASEIERADAEDEEEAA